MPTIHTQGYKLLGRVKNNKEVRRDECKKNTEGDVDVYKYTDENID